MVIFISTLSFLQVSDQLDVPAFISRLVELFFITRQFSELDVNTNTAKFDFLSSDQNLQSVKTEIDKLRDYALKQVQQGNLLKKVIILMELIRYNLIADFFPEEKEKFYDEKIAPNLHIVEYFLDFLIKRDQQKFEYYPISQDIINRIRSFIYLDETLQGLVMLFDRLATIKLITKNVMQERGVLYDKIEEFLKESRNDKTFFSTIESRWGKSKWTKGSQKLPIDSINKRRLYYFVHDWESILDTTLLDEERFHYTLHVLVPTYYNKNVHVTIKDLSWLKDSS